MCRPKVFCPIFRDNIDNCRDRHANRFFPPLSVQRVRRRNEWPRRRWLHAKAIKRKEQRELSQGKKVHNSDVMQELGLSLYIQLKLKALIFARWRRTATLATIAHCAKEIIKRKYSAREKKEKRRFACSRQEIS